MTLNEAIKHCEEVAEENQAIVDSCDYYGENMAKCEECAEEHRQLAAWLRELKQLREQMNIKADILNKIRAEIEQLPTKTRINWDGICPDPYYPEIEYIDVTKKYLLKIIDKCRAESEAE